MSKFAHAQASLQASRPHSLGRAASAWRRVGLLLAFLPITALSGCGSGPTSNSSQSAERRSPDAEAEAAPQDLIDLASTTPSQIQVERLTKGLGAAEAAVAPRPLPATAMLMLKHFEGWSAKAYNDSAGYCTIGYGHLISLQRCAATNLGQFASGISPSRGEELLEADTRAARAAVLRRVKTELKQEQFGALSNFVFNIGEANFSGSTMLSLLNLARSSDAAGQFGRWVKAKGKVQAGLVERRRCEASLFSGTLRLDPKGRFVRSGCAPLAAAAGGGEPIDIDAGEQGER